MKSKKIKELFNLFNAFFTVGITTFGGGVMMLAALKREIVEKRHYITEEEMYDFVTIAQATPGVIMVNSATLIGYRTAGILGSFFATIAVVTPSLIIISILGLCLEKFSFISHFLSKFLIGVRVAVCASSIHVIWGMIVSYFKLLKLKLYQLKSKNK